MSHCVPGPLYAYGHCILGPLCPHPLMYPACRTPVMSIVPPSCHVPSLLYSRPVMSIVPPSCDVHCTPVLSCPWPVVNCPVMSLLYPHPVMSLACCTLSCHVPGLLYSPVMSIVPLSCHVPGLLYITLSCPLYPHPVMSLACCTPVQPCLWPVVPPSCHDHGLFYPSPVMSLPYCAPVLVSLPSTPNPGLLGQWTGTPWKWAPSDTSRRHWLPIVHPPCVSQGKGASVMGKWMHIRGFSSCKGSPYVQNIHFLTDTRV